VAYDVSVLDAAPLKLIGVTRKASLSQLGETFMEAFDTVYKHLDAAQIDQRGHNVAFYTDVRMDGGEMSFEIVCGVEVGRDVPASDEVRLHETPGGPAAMTTHWGDYSELHAGHEAIHGWCQANGREFGRNWEVYGDWSDDPSQRRTDVYYELIT
jgi:effector-binding domain-containing protein